MISQKGGFFMFLRAQLSAQMATIADFLVTILLVRLFEVYYVYATLAGAVYGGIVNCVINYKWTFKSTGKKTNVAVKFILVWVCSIWLNTWGTYALTESLAKIPWVRDTLSQYFGDFFILLVYACYCCISARSGIAIFCKYIDISPITDAENFSYRHLKVR